MATYYVDMAVGDDANAGTSEGSGNAWKTIDKAMNIVAAGDKVWVKASADYTETATIDTAGGGTAPIVFEGYTSTTGDAGKITIDGASTRANGIATSLGSVDYFYVFKNFLVKLCTGIGFDIGSGEQVIFKNCEADTNGNWGFQGDNAIAFEECSSHGNTAGGGFTCDNDGLYVGCVAYDNTGTGIDINQGLVLFCLSYGNSVRQFHVQGAGTGWFVNCTCDSENVASTVGFNWGHSSTTNPLAVNCIAYDAATGFSAGRNLGEFKISRNNLVNSNTANYSNFTTHSGEVTGAPAFTDEGGADYTLASGSPAKAAGADAGETISDVSYVDIGAHQRQEPVGGGGGRVVLIG